MGGLFFCVIIWHYHSNEYSKFTMHNKNQKCFSLLFVHCTLYIVIWLYGPNAPNMMPMRATMQANRKYPVIRLNITMRIIVGCFRLILTFISLNPKLTIDAHAKQKICRNSHNHGQEAPDHKNRFLPSGTNRVDMLDNRSSLAHIKLKPKYKMQNIKDIISITLKIPVVLEP